MTRQRIVNELSSISYAIATKLTLIKIRQDMHKTRADGMQMPGAGAESGLACDAALCRNTAGKDDALPVIGVGTNRFGSASVATVDA